MRIVTVLGRDVIEVDGQVIEMEDGCQLSAKLWRPAETDAKPVPGIIETIPYRKRDERALRDSAIHRYLAAHGYACLRVDMRGTGDSMGLQERMVQITPGKDDNIQVLEWLAAQPWCTGEIGMMGLSWGGNNAIFTAARRPPQLKAILPISHTIDSYSHGLAWKGGCILSWNFAWTCLLLAYHTRPPDPELAGDHWRAMWLERLDGHDPQIRYFLGHQRRDEYWDTRTLDLASVGCPVFDVAGWADNNYANVVPHLLAELSVPRLGLVGPWGHIYPQQAIPGPAIGFLQEVRRWFDHWLKGEETGIMNEPMFRAFMREDLPARRFYDEAPGRWVAERSWPSDRIGTKRLALGPGTLAEEAAQETLLQVSSPQSVGLAAGAVWPWFAYAPGPELPGDQRRDDMGSLCFDSAPLPERLEIMGRPVANLEFAVDRPVANLALRLCDVRPDGRSSRVCYMTCNLPRRENDRAPEALEPGRRYPLTVPLDNTCYAFRAGHRIRLAISTAYWPTIWPSPEPVTLTLYTGASSLDLPVRPGDPEGAEPPRFEPPEAADPVEHVWLRRPRRRHRIEEDLARGETTLVLDEDNGRLRLNEHGLEVESSCVERRRIRDDDPATAVAEVEWTWRFERGDWRTFTRSRSRLTCTRESFHANAELDAFEGETRIFSKNWSFDFPRDLE